MLKTFIAILIVFVVVIFRRQIFSALSNLISEIEADSHRRREEAQRAESERIWKRDADEQDSPYMYQIGKHANEALAIRYGIANEEKRVKEYWYYAKGGVKTRNPERDTTYYAPAETIRLQKTKKLDKDLYEVLLSDHRDRKAKAIIEVGTEYVKTFYPLNHNWFEEHADLELALKGNGSFSLKELAEIHVKKTIFGRTRTS